MNGPASLAHRPRQLFSYPFPVLSEHTGLMTAGQAHKDPPGLMLTAAGGTADVSPAHMRKSVGDCEVLLVPCDMLSTLRLRQAPNKARR